MSKTKEIRSDFKIAVQGLVRKKYEAAHAFVRSSNSRMASMINRICYSSKDRLLRSLAVGFARVHARLDSNGRTKFRNDLFEEISLSFRAPLEYFGQRINKVLQKFYPGYRQWPSMQAIYCRMNILRQQQETKAFTWAMYQSLGYDGLGKMKAGSLLANALLHTDFLKLGDGLANYTKEQTKILHMMDTIFRQMLQYSHESPISVSAKNFFGYLGPKHSTHLKIPKQSDLNSDPCNIAENRNPQPCSIDVASPCCNLERTISSKREVALRFMKYTIGPQTSHVMEQSELSDTVSLANQFDYVLNKNFTGDWLPSIDPAIATCHFGTDPDESKWNMDCDLFERTYTTKGIGYSFNVEKFWTLHKRTSGNMAFYQQMTAIGQNNKVIHPIKDNGKGFSLEFYVRLNDDSASLTLHSPEAPADFHNEAIELIPDMINEITVFPSTVVTDAAGLRLSPTKRECLARQEADNLNIYQTYSQSACLFECQIKMAIDVCNCSSWDYPSFSDSTNLCTVISSRKCFYNIMRETMSPKQCDCPNSCSYVQYSTTTAIIPIDEEDLACNGDQDNLLLMRWEVFNCMLKHVCLHYLLLHVDGSITP